MIANDFMTPGSAPYQTARRRYFPPIPAWPKLSSDKVFVWEALFLVGKAIFGDDWTESEWKALDWPTAPEVGVALAKKRANDAVRSKAPQPTSGRGVRFEFQPAPDSSMSQQHEHVIARREHVIKRLVDIEQAAWNENEKAIARIKRASDWLDERFRDGKIKTFTRFVSTAGAPLDMPPSEWFCDDALNKRIRPGQYDRWYYTAQPSKHPVYIFVDRAGLEVEIATLSHATLLVKNTDLTQLPAPLKMAVNLFLSDPSVSGLGKKDRRRKVEAAWNATFSVASNSYIDAVTLVMAQEPDLDRVQRERDRAKATD